MRSCIPLPMSRLTDKLTLKLNFILYHGFVFLVGFFGGGGEAFSNIIFLHGLFCYKRVALLTPSKYFKPKEITFLGVGSQDGSEL